ncbi:hypothetical protein [Ottowia sp.]|uniref:hypothetical protein n=1 Tax=Ottowia sp. TaxID=1898956 RepID=UPI003A8BFC4F
MLPYLTIFSSSLVFLFGVYKYLDSRNREEKNKRFDQFRAVFIWFSGRDEKGQILTAVQQAVATYQLMEFPEYKSMSLPVIKHLISVTENEEPPSIFRKALLEVEQRLEN